jgi:hypothetical protein
MIRRWWATPASLRRDGNSLCGDHRNQAPSPVGNTGLSLTRWKLALRRSPKPGAFTGGQHQPLFDVMGTQAGTSSNKERQTEVGNTSLSSTRWKRLASDSAPVLRCTPGAPHLPPRPLPLPQEERKGSVGGAGEQERWQFLTKWSYMHATSLMMITHGYIYDR